MPVDDSDVFVCSGADVRAFVGASLPLKHQIKSVKTCFLAPECKQTLAWQLVHHLCILLRALGRYIVFAMRQTTLRSFCSVEFWVAL